MTEPLIVVISNRNVNPHKTNHELFGEEHNAAGWDQLRVATARHVRRSDDGGEGGWSLTLIEDDADQVPLPSKVLFDQIQQSVQSGELSNRFVFFVHGNNQTFLKNLNKARKLAVIHDVNVIAFSWPSRPELSGKRKRFRQAQKNAVRTAPALHDALEVISNYTESCTQHIEFNLLVHSLGNLLMKTFTEGFSPSASAGLFRRTVLHQGSPPIAGHHSWVNQIDVAHEVYHSINEKDKILGYAEAIDPKTMGRNRRALLAENAIYVDFTGGESVGNKHELFAIRDGYVNAVFQAVLTGQQPELETNFYFDGEDNAWRVIERRALAADLAAGQSPSDNSNPDYDPEFDDEEDQDIEKAYLRFP